MFEKIQLSHVSETFVYDSTKRFGGAPAIPNSIRLVEDPTYGAQLWRCVLNESGGNIAAFTTGGKGLQWAAGTLWAGPTVSNNSVAGTIRAKFCGVLFTAMPSTAWGWCQISGENLLSCLTLSAVNSLLWSQTGGNFDDTDNTAAAVGSGPVAYQTGATSISGSTTAIRGLITGAMQF